MKYCTKCGCACEDEYTFCPDCGNKLTEKTVQTVAEPIPTVEQNVQPAPCDVSADVAAANIAIASVLAAPAEEEKVAEVAAEAAVVEATVEAASAEEEKVAEATTEAAVEAAPVEAEKVAEVAAEAAVVEAAAETTPAEEKVVEAAVVEATATEEYVYEEPKIPEGGKGRGLAGVSFAFGLLSLLFFWVPGFNVVFFILSILGIIFANAAKKHYRYGIAIAGKVLSIFALVFNILLTLIFVLAIIFGFFYISSFSAYVAGLGNGAFNLIKTVGDFLGSIFLVK